VVVRNGNLAALTAKAKSGFNDGAWNGPGINSSTASADANGFTAVGIISNADIGYTDFAGVTGLGADDVLIKCTYYGDADLNGFVNLDDYAQFVDGLHHVLPVGWLAGDFNYDGFVNLDDYAQFVDAFHFNGPQLRGDDGSQVNAAAQQLDA